MTTFCLHCTMEIPKDQEWIVSLCWLTKTTNFNWNTHMYVWKILFGKDSKVCYYEMKCMNVSSFIYGQIIKELLCCHSYPKPIFLSVVSILFKNSKDFLHNITPSYIRYYIVNLNIWKWAKWNLQIAWLFFVWQGVWASWKFLGNRLMS